MGEYLKHLLESDREYHYRIKMVVPITECLLEKIERLLSKYELRDLTAPKKTIIQEHPLDFQDVSNSEVYYMDVVTGVPISSYILLQELRSNLHIPEKFVVVRSDNDPLEVETARLNAVHEMEKEAEEKGLDRKSLLSTNSRYPEADDSISAEELFGNEYNSKFLDELAAVSMDRNVQYSEPTEGMFNWLQNDVTEVGDKETFVTDDFNADKDGVKPVPWWLMKNRSVSSETKKVNDMISPEGNFDNDTVVTKRNYKDDAGKETTMIKKSKGVRDNG